MPLKSSSALFATTRIPNFSYLSRSSRRYASGRPPETDKSRILEKPARFNPPSHGSRRARPRSYPGPRLSDAEAQAQKTKRYPNSMPPEGTFMHRVLTNRSVHLWITLSTLAALAIYSSATSFLHTTEFRDQLPDKEDYLYHPFHSVSQFLQVYKLHTLHESEKISAKRRKKIEDADKRKEFLRKHGVEPGFLTGTWMDKFGSLDQDEAVDGLDSPRKNESDEQSVPEMDTVSSTEGHASTAPENVDTAERPKKKKPKMWLGIW